MAQWVRASQTDGRASQTHRWDHSQCVLAFEALERRSHADWTSVAVTQLPPIRMPLTRGVAIGAKAAGNSGLDLDVALVRGVAVEELLVAEQNEVQH